MKDAQSEPPFPLFFTRPELKESAVTRKVTDTGRGADCSIPENVPPVRLLNSAAIPDSQ